MRRTILDTAAYWIRHGRAPDEWVDRLAVPKWNAVTSPFRAVNAQDCAEDKLCVRGRLDPERHAVAAAVRSARADSAEDRQTVKVRDSATLCRSPDPEAP